MSMTIQTTGKEEAEKSKYDSAWKKVIRQLFEDFLDKEKDEKIPIISVAVLTDANKNYFEFFRLGYPIAGCL
jgi:hypothetical protein